MNGLPLPLPDTGRQIESLYQQFLSLPASEQKLLQVLSVIHKPIGIKKLEQVIGILVEDGIIHGPTKNYALMPARREALQNGSVLQVNKAGLQLNPLLSNRLTSEIALLPTLEPMTGYQTLQAIIMAAEEVVPVSSPASWQNKEADERRLLRDLFYLGQFDKLMSRLKINKNPQIIDHKSNQILVELLFLPFDIDFFLTLPEQLQYQAFATLFRECQKQAQDCIYATQLLETVCAIIEEQTDSTDSHCHHLLAEQYLYQQRFEDFQGILRPIEQSSYALQLMGVYQFLTGKNTNALKYFESALVAKNKVTKRKNPYLNGIPGYFYKLALMVAGNNEDTMYFDIARQQIDFEEADRKVKSEFARISTGLIKPIYNLSCGKKYNILVEYNCIPEQEDAFCHYLIYFNFLLAHVWCNQSKEPDIGKLAQKYSDKFQQLGYSLFSELCAQLASYIGNQSANKKAELINIATLTTPKPEWDLALDRLMALAPGNIEKQKTETQEIKPVRLIWEFAPRHHFQLTGQRAKVN